MKNQSKNLIILLCLVFFQTQSEFSDQNLVQQEDEIIPLWQGLPENEVHENSSIATSNALIQDALNKAAQEQNSFEEYNAKLCIRKSSEQNSREFNKELLAYCPEKLYLIIEELKNRGPFDDNVYYGIIPHTLLFVGPPGVGKSSLAKAIAEICQIQYIFIKAPLLANEYTNSGPSNLNRIFDSVFQSDEPYIIIIDELQTIIQKKDRNSDMGSAEALWVLLDECKTKNNVLVIATANTIDVLPEQLQSRLAKNIYHINLPNEQARKRIITYYLNKVSANISKKITETDLQYYAKKTQGFSIRDLEDMVEVAISNAFFKRNYKEINHKTLNKDDFEKAYRHIKKQKNSSIVPEWCKDIKNYLFPAIILPLGIAAVQLALQCYISYKTHQITYAQAEAHHQDFLALHN